MTASLINATMQAHLDMLRDRLQRAALSNVQASAAMAAGERNLAIGNILDLEHLLPECDALYRMVLLLHRSRDGER